MRPASFNARIVLLHIVIALVASILVQLALTYILREFLVRNKDGALQKEARDVSGFVMLFRSQGTSYDVIKELLERRAATKSEYFVEIRDSKGNIFFQSPNVRPGYTIQDTTRKSLASPTTLSVEHLGSLRVYSSEFQGFVLSVAYPLGEIYDLLVESYSSLMLLIPLTIVMLVLGELLMLYYLMRPVRRLNSYVDLVVRQPYHADLPEPRYPAKGELGRVVDKVYEMVRVMQRSRNQALNFSSMASHEIRTPLTIIRSQLESALDLRLSNSKLRKIVGSTYDEMLRLNRTVEDLLNLSTLQAGTFKLDLETVSLGDFMRRFYDEALFLTRPKKIAVVLKKGPRVFLQVDVARLRQVFFNLMDNAIRHTADGKRIRFSYDVEDHHVVIFFSDAGGGIPPEKLSKVFEPFYRYSSNGTKSGGAGLGLALVKWIVESHGGTVDVKSELGVGTTFMIRLPLVSGSISTPRIIQTARFSSRNQ
jgi:signal transduction histidine kinase